jgi:hypothetical protein
LLLADSWLACNQHCLLWLEYFAASFLTDANADGGWGLCCRSLLQMVYIDHDKAKDCEEQILEVNAVPAAHSKGLLERPHPGNTPSAMVLDASQQGGADNSDVSDDEVAEASQRGRSDDGIASKL